MERDPWQAIGSDPLASAVGTPYDLADQDEPKPPSPRPPLSLPSTRPTRVVAIYGMIAAFRAVTVH